MPYKKAGKTKIIRQTYRKGNKRIEKVRKMVGTKPETTMDKISKWGGVIGTIGSSVASIASMINVEDKFVDSTINYDLSAGTPINGQVLNQIAQGSDVNQRNGNKILDKYLQVNLRVFLDATATALATQTVRIVILIDKKPQIGALTWNTVYSGTNNVTGLINKNTAGDRIVVLQDKKMVLNGGNMRLFYKKLYINLSRIHSQYTGSTATAYESGMIYILAITDVAGASPDVHVRGDARFAYMDN